MISSGFVSIHSPFSQYLPFAESLQTDLPVIVAGYPKDSIDALKEAGVDDFIHIKLDQLTALDELHTRFGIPPTEPAAWEVA